MADTATLEQAKTTQPETEGPPQPKQEQFFDPNELTPKEIIEAAQAAQEAYPKVGGRVTLELIAAKGNPIRAIENKANEYLERGKENPQDMAMGLDLKEEAFYLRYYEIERQLKTAQGDEVVRLKNDQVEIVAEWRKTFEERKKISEEHPDLGANQLHEFAKSFGIDEKTIFQRGSLFSVRELLTEVIANEETRASFIKKCHDNGMPGELVGALEKFINDGRLQEGNNKHENVKKYGKRVAMAGGAVGLMMVLAGWFAMKMESGGRRQQ